MSNSIYTHRWLFIKENDVYLDRDNLFYLFLFFIWSFETYLRIKQDENYILLNYLKFFYIICSIVIFNRTSSLVDHFYLEYLPVVYLWWSAIGGVIGCHWLWRGMFSFDFFFISMGTINLRVKRGYEYSIESV